MDWQFSYGHYFDKLVQNIVASLAISLEGWVFVMTWDAKNTRGIFTKSAVNRPFLV